MHQESFSSGYDIENQLKCYFVVEAWIEKKNNKKHFSHFFSCHGPNGYFHERTAVYMVLSNYDHEFSVLNKFLYS